VLVQLFPTLGDASGIEAAMLRAIPDRAKVEELKRRKTFLEPELSKVEAGRRRLIDSVADGLLSNEKGAGKIAEIRDGENLFKSEIEGIDAQLSVGPTEDEIWRRAKLLRHMIRESYQSPSRLTKMTLEERQNVVLTFFEGKDAKYYKLGVYLERDQITENIKYKIRGNSARLFWKKSPPMVSISRTSRMSISNILKA